MMMDGLKKSHKKSLANLSKLFVKQQKSSRESLHSTSPSPPHSPGYAEFYAATASTYFAQEQTRAALQATNQQQQQQQEESESELDLKAKPIQARRHSFSNVHESAKARLAAQKRNEYNEKMNAFDELIKRRRGSCVRLLTQDVVAA